MRFLPFFSHLWNFLRKFIISRYLFSGDKQDTNETEQTETICLPRTEVIKRLRERGHPIWLFGESEVQSFKRLRRIEIQEPEANRVSILIFTSLYYWVHFN